MKYLKIKKNNKTLYLHLGLHKTATTSIQKTLYNNSKILDKKGIHYLNSIGFNHSQPFCIAFSQNANEQFNNKLTRVSKKEIEFRKQRFFRKVKKELNDNKRKNIVISGEDIGGLPNESLNKVKAFLKNILPEHQIRIILFLRNPVSYITSAHQQVIKRGNNSKNKPCYDSIMQKIENLIYVFGINNIHFTSFEEACKNPCGPVGEFLKIICSPRNKIKRIPQNRENFSISHQSIEIILFLNNQYPLIKNGLIQPGRYDNDTKQFEEIQGNKYSLSCKQQNNIIRNQKKNLEWIKDATNIDYTSINAVKPPPIKYLAEYPDQFIEAVNQSNTLIRFLAFKFIESKLKEDIPLKQKEMFHKIKQIIKSKHPDIAQSPFDIINREDQTVKRLQQFINKTNDVSDFDIYREITSFLEGFDEKEKALKFCEKALEIRPNNPFMLKKHEELKKEINPEN